ncbi:MAG: tetratricopeptide repeat protein [Planctomycetota bacterium]
MTAPEKALRYHAALRRAPRPGLVFERFCDAWLEERPVDTLDSFLVQRAESDAPEDALILGFYRAREGRNVEALRVLRRTLEAHPGEASAWFFKAELEAATLDFDTALSDLTRAAGADPDDELAESIATLRGRLLVRVGRPDDAAAAWSALIEQRPDDPELYEALVVVQADEGQFDAALATLDALIERTTDPQKRVARGLWRGDLLDRAGRGAAAREAYEAQLSRVGAGDWLERQVVAQLEQVYRREREVEAFAQRLAELAEQHPDRLLLLRRRAAVLGELGRTDDAIAQWRAVLERSPGDAEVRGRFADVLADAGRSEQAIAVVEAMRDERPNDGELRLRLAGLYAKADRKDDATAEVRAYLDGSDGALSSAMRAVRTLERLELDDAAEATARAYAERHPDEPGAAEALAELLFRLGQADEATAMWSAMAAGAGDAAGLLEAVRAMRSRGLVEPAMAALTQRVGDFADEAEVLAALADTALRGGDAGAALPWLRRWVAMLDDAEALGRAVDTARRVARSAEADDELIRELAAAEPARRSAGEAWLLAALHEQIGDSPAADAALSASAEAFGDVGDGDSSARLLTLARVELLRQRREYGAAADTLATLAERPGGARSSVVRDLIDLYERDQRSDDALAWVERWKRVAPGSVGPWLREARLLTTGGADEEALRVLEGARRRFPEDVTVATTLAERYAAAGRNADAERVYWGLYDAAESTAAKIGWVTRLAELRRWENGAEGVIRQLEQRRDQDRTAVEPHLALAEVYRVLDRYEPRRAALIEAARVQPRNVDLLLTTARTEERAGDFEQAAATLRRALTLDASSRTRQRLAALYVATGDTERAVALIRGTDGTPPTADEALAFADALAARDEWQAAAEFLDTVGAAAAGDYRVAYLRGVALLESRRLDAAAEHFFEVLAVGEERPGHTPQTANMFTQMLGRFDDLLPPEAMKLQEQMMAGWRAVQHRNAQNRVVFMGAATPGTTVPLPMSYEDGHMLAVAHLRMLADEADEAGRAAIRAGLERAGVALVDVLMALPADPQMGFNGLPPDVLEDHADEPAVLAMGTLMASFGQGVADPELMQRAAETFDTTYPGSAMLARMWLLSDAARGDEEAAFAEHWPPLEALLKRVEEPSDYLVIVLAQRLGIAGQMGVSDLVLPEDKRRFVARRLMDWYGTLDPNSQLRPFVLQMMLAEAFGREDWAAAAQLLQEETRRHRAAAGPTTNQTMMMRFAGHGNATEVMPLAFPPAELTSVPPLAAQVLGGNNPFGGAVSVDTEAVADAIDGEAYPLLRGLVAGLADDEAALRAAVEPLAEGEAPSLDALLLMAAWDGREGRAAAAGQRLVRASYLPMRREQRRRIDGAIVAYALDAGEPENPELFAAARRSALRLRATAATYEQRAAVVDALASLGLEEEADKMEARLAAAPVAPSPGNFRPAAAATVTSPVERIRTALNEGRRDDALRLAKRQAEALGQNLAQGNAWVLRQNETAELRRLLSSRGLTAELIADADPGPDAPPRRLTQFGHLLEVLEDTDGAAEAYRAASRERGDPTSVARLVLIEVQRQDPEAAAAALAVVEPRRVAALHQFLQNASHSVSHEDPSFGTNLALTHAIWLEGLDDEDVTTLQVPWLTTVWWGLMQQMWVNGEQVPSLYSRTAWKKRVEDTSVDPDPDPDPDTDTVYPLTQRAEAHDRLARACLRLPSAAPDAAARLVLLAELRGQPLTPLIDTLAAALRLERKAAAFGGIHYGHTNDLDIATPRPAHVELVRLASRADRLDTVRQTSAALREQRRRAEADRLDALLTLYTAEGDDMVAAAEALVQRGRRVTPGPGDGSARTIVEAWEAAGRPAVALDRPLIEVAERMMANDTAAAAAIVDYAAAVAERDGRHAGAALLESFASAFIAPPTRRDDLIRRHYAANSWSSNSPTGKMYLFVNLMQQHAAREPALVWAALDQLRPYADHPEGRDVVSSAIETATDRLGAVYEAGDDVADTLIVLLEDAPLLADGDAFRSYPSRNPNNRTRSFFDRLFAMRNELDGGNAGKEAERIRDVLARLEAWLTTQPDTLGRALALSRLRGDDAAEALTVLSDRGEQIAALEPATQREVLAALPPLDGPPDGASAGAVAVYTALTAAEARGHETRVKEFLELRRLDPQGSHWEMQRNLGGLALALADGGDTDRAVELLAHWNDLVEQQQRQQGWTNTENAAETLGDAMGRGEHGLSGAVLAVRLAGEPRVGYRLHGDAEHGLRRALHRFHQGIETSDEDVPESTHRYLKLADALAERVGPEASAAVLLHALEAVARNHTDNEHYAEIEAGLADRAHADRPGGVWSTAVTAVRIARLRRGGNDDASSSLASGDRAAVAGYLTAVAADAELPRVTRLGVCRVALEAMADKAPPVPAVVQLLAETLEQEADALTSTEVGTILAHVWRLRDRADATTAWPDPDALVRSVTRAAVRSSRQQHNQLQVSAPSSYGAQRGPGRAVAPGWGLVALELAAEADMQAELRQLLQLGQSALGRSPAAWAVLARAGQADLAAEQLRRHHAEALPALVQGVAYDARLRDAADELAEAAARAESDPGRAAGLALIAEAAIASAYEPPRKDGEDPGWPDRRTRLTELARGFGAQTIDDPTLRKTALRLIASDDEAAALLEAPLTEALGDTTLGDTIDPNGGAGDPPTAELIYAALAGPQRRGDAEPLLAHLASVDARIGDGSNAGWRVESTRRVLRDLFWRRLTAETPGDTPAAADTRLAAARVVWTRLLDAPEDLPNARLRREDLARLAALYAIDPAQAVGAYGDQLNKFSESLREDARHPSVANAAQQVTWMLDRVDADEDRRFRAAMFMLKEGRIERTDAVVIENLVFSAKVFTPETLEGRHREMAETMDLSERIGLASALARGRLASAESFIDEVAAQAFGRGDVPPIPEANDSLRLALLQRLLLRSHDEGAKALAETWNPAGLDVRKQVIQAFKRRNATPPDFDAEPETETESTPVSPPAATPETAV